MSQKWKIIIFVVLHVVGFVGFVVPLLQPFFKQITPLHLLFVTMVLYWDKDVFKNKALLFFLIAGSIGFWTEWLGVNTGLLFGNYIYSGLLGPMFANVPLMLFVLWAGVSLAANQTVQYFLPKGHPLFKALWASILMVLFDLMLEQFATMVGLWTWYDGVIPVFNYISWLLVSLFINLLYQLYFRLPVQKSAVYYLASQTVFFIVVVLILSFQNA